MRNFGQFIANPLNFHPAFSEHSRRSGTHNAEQAKYQMLDPDTLMPSQICLFLCKGKGLRAFVRERNTQQFPWNILPLRCVRENLIAQRLLGDFEGKKSIQTV
ncbi:MAG: hypothetical protein WB679_04960 [Terracidiphilus sp.]